MHACSNGIGRMMVIYFTVPGRNTSKAQQYIAPVIAVSILRNQIHARAKR
jgi:hypothetical protein